MVLNKNTMFQINLFNLFNKKSTAIFVIKVPTARTEHRIKTNKMLVKLIKLVELKVAILITREVKKF